MLPVEPLNACTLAAMADAAVEECPGGEEHEHSVEGMGGRRVYRMKSLQVAKRSAVGTRTRVARRKGLDTREARPEFVVSKTGKDWTGAWEYMLTSPRHESDHSAALCGPDVCGRQAGWWGASLILPEAFGKDGQMGYNLGARA